MFLSQISQYFVYAMADAGANEDYNNLYLAFFTFLVITGVVISNFSPSDFSLLVKTGVVISIFSFFVF